MIKVGTRIEIMRRANTDTTARTGTRASPDFAITQSRIGKRIAVKIAVRMKVFS